MAKYLVVAKDKVPTPLRDGEYVINAPDFAEEIALAQDRSNSRRKLTTASYLRSIANMVFISYDSNLDALRDLHPHLYQGREFNSPQELSAIVLEMLKNDCPTIFTSYLDKKIKQRPSQTKLIYYTGNSEDAMPFLSNGIDNIDPKDVDSFLGLKTKKSVG